MRGREPVGEVLVISQVPPPVHGSTVMTETFLETLTAIGLSYTLVDRRFSKSIGDVGAFSARKVLAAIGLVFRLLSRLTRRPKACIFFITNRPASCVVDWVLSEVLRLSRTPVVAYVHTNGYTALAGRGRGWGWLVGRLLGAAELTVCLSPRMVGDVREWLDEATTRCIPNTAPEAPASGVGRLPRVLFLSNLIPEKGADTFTELAIALAPGRPELTFVMAGAQPDAAEAQRIVARIERAGLSDRISLAGPVDTALKWELIQSSRLLVFPSRYPYEAQPLTIVEALSAGTPVIALDVGAVADLVESGTSGVVLPADRSSRLKEEVAAVLDDEERWSALSSGARRAYESRHSAAAYRDAWERLMREIKVIA